MIGRPYDTPAEQRQPTHQSHVPQLACPVIIPQWARASWPHAQTQEGEQLRTLTARSLFLIRRSSERRAGRGSQARHRIEIVAFAHAKSVGVVQSQHIPPPRDLSRAPDDLPCACSLRNSRLAVRSARKELDDGRALARPIRRQGPGGVTTIPPGSRASRRMSATSTLSDEIQCACDALAPGHTEHYRHRRSPALTMAMPRKIPATSPAAPAATAATVPACVAAMVAIPPACVATWAAWAALRSSMSLRSS
jgi:hypothetical protein